jgi:hypothetical protein
MAKQKGGRAAEPVAAEQSEMARVIAEINAKYGAGIVRPGQALVDDIKHVIPMTPALDAGLGGGIPEGSWVSMSGPEKSGKTTTALSFIAECQKPEHGSRPIMILSVEHRLKRRDLIGIKGLKVEEPHLYFVESTKGNILTGPMFLDIGGNFLKSVPGGVLLIDSVSSLLGAKLAQDGLGASDFGSSNKIVADFCTLNAPVVKTNDNICVGIVQYYTNTSGYGKKWVEKAAKKWQYQADVQLQVDSYKPWRVGASEDSEQIGHEITWLIKTSALGAPSKVESFHRFGIGIDKSYELFLIAHGVGLVTGIGWYTFNFLADKPDLLKGTDFEEKGEVKVQGKEKALALLAEHPAWEAELHAQLGVFLGRGAA